ncbi:MAG: oxygen-independent coproporphyrinogen III oxidase-like protein [Gammaproteobacteria bacterium]|nr:oxygen-independent coproporphyrinogen III oxidase-like protein [Gammaproteobacteria bacterium]
MQHFTQLPPLALYLHFPWCVRKCPYCDFNSHEAKDALPEAAYIDALLQDLEQELPAIWGRSIVSIFMGGGTPSLFSPEAMDRLLSALRARLNFPANIEITMEANPGTIERDKFAEFRAAGINRLSIGVQSFQDEFLTKLGRIHSARDAIRAAETAHKVGLENFNLDLMYALPGQTLPQAQADIATAIDLYPSHISYYQLTIEPNTFFYHQPPTLPDDELTHDIETRNRARLAEAGYVRYEISAYARNNQRCVHNMNYWQFGDYLGIGAGAHGKLSDAHQQQISRSWKVKNPRDYLASAGTPQRIGGSSILSAEDTSFEFMLNALRLIDGVDTALFEQHTGLSLSQIEDTLARAQERELLELRTNMIRPTPRGLDYLNDLTGMFLQETADAG